MKRKLVILGIAWFLCLLAGLGGWWIRGIYSLDTGKFFLRNPEIKRPLVKYEIPEMKKADWIVGEMQIVKILSEEDRYTSYLFEFEHYPNFDSSTPKITTGQINIPRLDSIQDEEVRSRLMKEGFPVVLMLRGFVSQEIYQTGIGSRNGAAYFASNGFVTIAPDFLGYAGSDGNAADIFESRFQTYVTAISTLKRIEQFEISTSPSISDSPDLTLVTQGNAITTPIFIWAHSNGGQIALTLLEVTNSAYPTTLWAPVTKGFPYSVLYYTDESIDKGKFIRRELSEFEQLYDTDLYSIDNYLEEIQAPIQLHQGGNDDAIPLDWSTSFANKLQALDKDITYYTYPSADHNMRPDWDEVIERDLKFFNTHLDIDDQEQP